MAVTSRFLLLSVLATTFTAQPGSVPRASLRLVGTDRRCDALGKLCKETWILGVTEHPKPATAEHLKSGHGT